MMQELLLALLGYDGPIFHEDKQKFQVCDGIFLAREEPILQRVLEAATQYSRILLFTRGNSSGQGRYRAALAAAVTEATQPYRDAIVHLEAEVLANPELSLTHLHTSLHPHTPALLTLTHLLDQVTGQEVRGCRLLETVHQHTQQAVLDGRQLMCGLEQRVHAVLYDQLSQWLLYGALLDPHGEFFLQPEAGSDTVCLVPELLPGHIPAVVAHKILFIGEAVREFEGQHATGRGRAAGAGRLLQSQESEFLQQLSALSRARAFSLADLSRTVETIRTTVSKHLSDVVVSGGLVDALTDLKDVLLLGRGELYQVLLTTATHMLDGPVNTAANVSVVFQSCGQLVHVEEQLLERYSVSCSQLAVDQLPQVVADTVGHAGTGWSSLCLQYSSSPVLQPLLGTPSVQRSYSSLFAFLLCVRRAQHRLHSCWITHLKDTRRVRESRAAGTLRHQMTLLLDGLQYYLQVDVLESHHYRLVSSLASCSDYQQLQGLINTYLANLLSHCYIRHKLVSRCFSLVFSLCHKLCDVLQGKDESVTVAAVDAEFSDACSKLFLVLCSLQRLPGQQHTASLLARLDYNTYYRDQQRCSVDTE